MMDKRSGLSDFARQSAVKTAGFVLAVLAMTVIGAAIMYITTQTNKYGVLIPSAEDLLRYYARFGGADAYHAGLPELLAQRAHFVITALTGSATAFLLLLIYLLLVAGRRPGDDRLYMHGFDRLYTDINVFLLFVLTGVCVIVDLTLWPATFFDSPPPPLFWLLQLVVALASALGLALLLSLMRHCKNHSLLKNSMLGAFVLWVVRGVSNLLNDRPIVQRLVLTALIVGVGFALLGGISFWLSVLFIPFLLYWIRKKALAYAVIREGVTALKEGDLKHQIPLTKGTFTATLKAEEDGREQELIIKENSELYALAADINAIGDGLKLAVERELQSERMKSELISNVSHDLRTPLTSIITYIDLLKTEGPDSANAAGYLEILEQKASRLKALTDDLFEASKASSGSIAVTLESVELVDLLSQGLGELEAQVNASGLDFRLELPEEKIWVTADGRLLWRVIENLLSNIFKYAQPGSRVYIEPAAGDGWGQITMKNISANPLNISPDILMERFTRGDEARSSEGSGLGLSIARSLTELQGGQFALEIDGDLFKAIIKLPA